MDNHLPGCAALRCPHCGSRSVDCTGGLAHFPDHYIAGSEVYDCTCELGRLRAEVEKLKAHCKHHKAFEDAATHEAETLRDWQRRANYWLKRLEECAPGYQIPEDKRPDLIALIAEAGQTDVKD